MNDLERRLEAAAEETRQLARDRTPAPLEQKSATPVRGWLVLAAAFAVVVITFGLIPWLANTTEGPPVGDTTPPDAPVTTAVPETPASTVPDTVPSTVPETSCSSAGVPLPAEAPGLPAAVSETRDAIITAAAACNFAALEELAAEDFSSSFGNDVGAEAFARWEEEGEGKLGILLRLLDMSYGTNELNGGAIYVWPAAATYATWDAVPPEQKSELTSIYTDEEMEEFFAGFGSYAGWRTGINQDGEWLYFTAGD